MKQLFCLLLAASLAGAGVLYAQTRRLRDENARLDAQAAERDTRIETLTAEALTEAFAMPIVVSAEGGRYAARAAG